MKKLLLTLLLALSIFTLASCHYSSYQAVLLIQSSTKETLNVSFDSLKGRMVKSIEKTSDDNDELSYEASIVNGEMTIYYEIMGEVKPLFTIKSGESVKDKLYGIKKGTKVYIILETVDKVEEGHFSFSVK